MQGPERLGLVKASMKMLVEQFGSRIKVAIVVYAGAAGLVLPSTSGKKRKPSWKRLKSWKPVVPLLVVPV
jgi:Ca-activated chloride channel family protein